MDMFVMLGKIKDGTLTTTRGMDQDDEVTLVELMHDGYLTGMRTRASYISLKLTEKGEQTVAFGRLPLSELIPKKKAWWQHPFMKWLGLLATALLTAYLTFLFGWN